MLPALTAAYLNTDRLFLIMFLVSSLSKLPRDHNVVTDFPNLITYSSRTVVALEGLANSSPASRGMPTHGKTNPKSPLATLAGSTNRETEVQGWATPSGSSL